MDGGELGAIIGGWFMLILFAILGFVLIGTSIGKAMLIVAGFYFFCGFIVLVTGVK